MTYQSQLGQQQQAFEQAQLDAAQIAAREAEFQPFTQLGLIGQQLAQIQPGAFPTQTVGYAPPAAPASPMSQFLGGAAGIAGIGGKLRIIRIMSRILRRPMFRGGPVDSRGTGITSGLMDTPKRGGRVGQEDMQVI